MSLKVRRLTEEPGIDETEEGYSGVNTVWAGLKREDLSGFSSRIFRMKPGGHTPMHAHDREHTVVVIRGTCQVESDSNTWKMNEGNIVTVPKNPPHRFTNPGSEGAVILIMNLFTQESTEAETEGDNP